MKKRIKMLLSAVLAVAVVLSVAPWAVATEPELEPEQEPEHVHVWELRGAAHKATAFAAALAVYT